MSENDELITQKDGFRPRRKRERGWLKAAIKDGSVRAPNAPDPDEGAKHRTGGLTMSREPYTGTVIKPPMATLDGDGR